MPRRFRSHNTPPPHGGGGRSHGGALRPRPHLHPPRAPAPAGLSARRTRRAGPARRVSRVSLLPDALLRDVVSRLPDGDVVRTAALSRRRIRVWRSTPLVLADSHLLSLLGGGGDGTTTTDPRPLRHGVQELILANRPEPRRRIRDPPPRASSDPRPHRRIRAPAVRIRVPAA